MSKRGGVGRRSWQGSLDRLFRFGTASGLSDGQLLERFANRHDEAAEAAFAVLIERHGAMVWRVCLQSLADPDDAQDAFQATFLVLMKKAGSVRRQDSVGSWLHGVARRVAARAKCEAARRKVVEREAGCRRPQLSGSMPVDDAQSIVWEEVDRLPRALRTAVLHCYLQGLTHEQAAARLGWPVGTVRSRLARARDRLRGRLERRGLAPSVVLALPGLSGPFPWPVSLVDRTARAALTLAARDAASAGLVSAAAASLTEGVLQAMFLGTVKTNIAAAVVFTGTLLAGAGVYAYQQEARPRNRERPARAESPDAPRPREIVREGVDTNSLEFIAIEIINMAGTARAFQERGDFPGARMLVQGIQRRSDEWAQSLSDRLATREIGSPDDSLRSTDQRPRIATANPAEVVRDRRPTPDIAPLQERTIAHERRLEVLEKKLDRVLEALEARPAVESRLEPLDLARPARARSLSPSPAPRVPRTPREAAPARATGNRRGSADARQDHEIVREEPVEPIPSAAPVPPVPPVAPTAPAQPKPSLERAEPIEPSGDSFPRR